MTTPLPKQIQDQLAQAEELEKAMMGEAQQAENEEQPSDPASAETPPTQGESQEPNPGEEAPEEAPAEATPDDGVWEAKYRTLQAKYDAEVPRLHQQNKDLLAQFEGLKDRLEALREQAAPKPEPKQEETRFVSEKDEEDFGSDLIDLQRRVTREEMRAVADEMSALRNQVTELVRENAALKDRTAQTASSQYAQDIDRLVPDWREINSDPEWLSWLGEVDPLVGAPRQALLDAANNAQNAERVAAIFDAFKSLRAPATKPAEPDPSLSRQVTPSRTSSKPASGTNAGKKVWSQKDVAVALDPRNLKGKTSEEVEALMKEIDAATAEGRIQI